MSPSWHTPRQREADFNQDLSIRFTDGLVIAKLCLCLIDALALSFVAGWLTLRTGSVLPATLAHGLMNVFGGAPLGPVFPWIGPADVSIVGGAGIPALSLLASSGRSFSRSRTRASKTSTRHVTQRRPGLAGHCGVSVAGTCSEVSGQEFVVDSKDRRGRSPRFASLDFAMPSGTEFLRLPLSLGKLPEGVRPEADLGLASPSSFCRSSNGLATENGEVNSSCHSN